MKKILFVLAICSLLISCTQFGEREYHGKVIDRYVLTSASGQGNYYIIFHSDSLAKNIIVHVNPQTYVNSQLGKKVSYMLSGDDLSR